MKKIIIFSIIYLFNFSTACFDLINLDEALIAHQKAFKDFEPYESSCNVDTCKYRSFNWEITESRYEFDFKESNFIAKLYILKIAQKATNGTKWDLNPKLLPYVAVILPNLGKILQV